MWHMLNKRLIWKLLRTIGNILCGISWWGGHNWWARCWGWVHHGALMMLVLPLLGHIWYCRKDDLVLENTISLESNTRTRSTRLCMMWPSCLPLQCHVIPLSPPLQPLWPIFLLHMPQIPIPNPQLGQLWLILQVSAWKQLHRRPSLMTPRFDPESL